MSYRDVVIDFVGSIAGVGFFTDKPISALVKEVTNPNCWACGEVPTVSCVTEHFKNGSFKTTKF